MIQERAMSDESDDRSKQEAGSSPGVTINEEPGPEEDRIAGEPDGSTYCHESG